jgi:endonuclease YncB( thermonuclease family)
MKTLLKLSLLAAGLAAALPLVNAADPAAPAAAARHPRLHALLAHRQALRQRVAKKLGLSAGQISQLKAERAKTATAVKTIRGDTLLTAKQKKTQIRDAMKSARSAMLGVLTPDQQARLREMRTRFRARG